MMLYRPHGQLPCKVPTNRHPLPRASQPTSQSTNQSTSQPFSQSAARHEELARYTASSPAGPARPLVVDGPSNQDLCRWTTQSVIPIGSSTSLFLVLIVILPRILQLQAVSEVRYRHVRDIPPPSPPPRLIRSCTYVMKPRKGRYYLHHPLSNAASPHPIYITTHPFASQLFSIS